MGQLLMDEDAIRLLVEELVTVLVTRLSVALENRPATVAGRRATTTAAKRMIDSHEAAAMIGITEPALRQWRSDQRDQPVYYKPGGRVRYKVRDVEAWIARQAVIN